MRAAWWLVAALLLAGCSDDGGAPELADTGEAPALDVTATATTGAVRGVVVDDAIRPVADVVVTLRTPDGAQEQTTDAQGRFAFSNVIPGTHFLSAASPAHEPAQVSVQVVAGVDEPPVTKILLARLFAADPYVISIKQAGFFECSQAGAILLYSSSNCVTDYTKAVTGPPGLLQPLDNVTNQEREWHADVDAGWQTVLFEMDWEPSTSGTSGQLGIVVSTYKPEREGRHWFAEEETGKPLRLQIDVGAPHPSASGVEPAAIPPGGMQDMSYFVSVKQDNWPVPAVALEQEFDVYLNQFVYAPAPEGWSFVAGDAFPF
ncbi:MAG: carboxypeptidase-like regulatory domain-containing protein [Thermoplasmatota archaeon]